MNDTLRAPVYAIRHEDTAQADAMQAVQVAFKEWAAVSGEAEENSVFVGVNRVSIDLVDSTPVSLFPDHVWSECGEYILSREPDAPLVASPYVLELFELQVEAERMPKETSLAVLVGTKAREASRDFDFHFICEEAQNGCRTIDIKEIAKGQDGVYGLVQAVADAAAQQPNSDMWNFANYSGDQEDVTLMVFSD